MTIQVILFNNSFYLMNCRIIGFGIRKKILLNKSIRNVWNGYGEENLIDIFCKRLKSMK